MPVHSQGFANDTSLSILVLELKLDFTSLTSFNYQNMLRLDGVLCLTPMINHCLLLISFQVVLTSKPDNKIYISHQQMLLMMGSRTILDPFHLHCLMSSDVARC